MEEDKKVIKKFPSIRKEITRFIEDEDGGIPTGKLFMVGAFCIVLSSLFLSENVAYAAHSSHKSHSSHVSTSYHRSHGSHSNSHSSHSSYTHSSHSSSTHSSHSNNAPSVSSILPPQKPVDWQQPAFEIPAVSADAILGKPLAHEETGESSSSDLPSVQEAPYLPEIVTNKKLRR